MKIVCYSESGEVMGDFSITSDRDPLVWKRILSYLMKNKTLLEKVTRQSLHQYIIDTYSVWMIGEHKTHPMIDGSDGKAATSIAKYLMKACEGDQEKAENSWKIILTKHQYWEKFHQKQLRLRQINSNLVNIINNVRKQNGVDTSQNVQSAIRKRFETPK